MSVSIQPKALYDWLFVRPDTILSHAFLSPVPRVLMTFYTKTSGFAADAAAPLAIVMSPVSRALLSSAR